MNAGSGSGAAAMTMGVLAKEIVATYEVLSKMGEGGMGAVYKVRHRFFDEIRVIKIMQAQPDVADELRERFLSEARRGKELRHPNLAEVLDFSMTADGTAYIVMEYIEGVTLRDMMARNGGPLDYRTVVGIADQALDALAFLHGRKFVHRDISPDNLMLTQANGGQPRVKLIDLGIAKALEDNRRLTITGKFLGKVRYAAPEQFNGNVDARSDLYSLGIVLYELLTGVDPITGDDYYSVIAGHMTRPPRSFEQTDPNGHVPQPIRDAVLKAMEKRPEDRYQTAAAFAEALRAPIPISEQRTLLRSITTPLPETTSREPLPAEALEQVLKAALHSGSARHDAQMVKALTSIVASLQTLQKEGDWAQMGYQRFIAAMMENVSDNAASLAELSSKLHHNPARDATTKVQAHSQGELAGALLAEQVIRLSRGARRGRYSVVTNPRTWRQAELSELFRQCRIAVEQHGVTMRRIFVLAKEGAHEIGSGTAQIEDVLRQHLEAMHTWKSAKKTGSYAVKVLDWYEAQKMRDLKHRAAEEIRTHHFAIFEYPDAEYCLKVEAKQRDLAQFYVEGVRRNAREMECFNLVWDRLPTFDEEQMRVVLERWSGS